MDDLELITRHERFFALPSKPLTCMRSLLGIGFLWVSSLACRPSPPAAPAALPTPGAHLKTTSVLEAFEHLKRDTFQVTRTLIVLDNSGRLLGQEVRTGRYRPDAGLQWLRIDREGTFPPGSFGPEVRNAGYTPLAAVQPLWPDPLPFLQPRQRDAYHFHPLPDTMLFNRRIARLGVFPADTAHSALKAFQGVLYLDGAQLVGAELQEAYATLFGKERRYLSVWINPNEGRLVREQFLLEVDPIGQPPYRFCLETQYTYGDRVSQDEASLAFRNCLRPLPQSF